MSKSEIAKEMFKSGFSCSQAVFSTYVSEKDMDKETALKVAAGFEGGMGLCAKNCGAVTGALLVIGLKNGMSKLGDTPSKIKTNALVKEFIEKFSKENGSDICKELLVHDISTKEGLEKAKQEGVFGTKCPGYVGSACRILEEIMKDDL